MPDTEREEREGFRELLLFTLGGYALSLVSAYILDTFNLQRNPIGEWIVRTFAGEGESIFEGIFAIKNRLLGGAESLAEAYGWGKFLGIALPWLVDWGSRLAGVNMYSWESFYVPYLYAMGDQIGATLSMLLFFSRREGGILPGLVRYLQNPVSVASLLIILIVPVGLLTVRLLGFSPTTQIFVSLETIAANLCWVPPLVGAILEGKNG